MKAAMTEPTADKEITPARPAPKERFRDILECLCGKTVTIVNPLSLEDAPMGWHLKPGFYRARLVEVRGDFVVLATEFQHRRGQQGKELVKQFLPIDKIKRISIMKDERLLHL